MIFWLLKVSPCSLNLIHTQLAGLDWKSAGSRLSSETDGVDCLEETCHNCDGNEWKKTLNRLGFVVPGGHPDSPLKLNTQGQRTCPKLCVCTGMISSDFLQRTPLI